MPFAKISSASVENLVVGHRLVDHAAQTVGPGFRSNRDAALSAGLEDAHDRLGEIVETKRCRADGVAHLVQARENPLDVGMVAERDGHEADTARVDARRPPPAEESDRQETREPAGSCSRPSRSGTDSRTRGRPRSGSAIRTRFQA